VASAQVTAFLRDRAVPFDTDDPTHPNADLQPFEAMVGSARVVSLGEGTHGTAEFFRMKHRLLRVLVEEMGFTAFGIEASFPDSEPINDYVLHGRGDARRALAGQGFWTWRTEEVLAMVEWMRAYNAAHGPVLSFRGFDMQHPLTAMDLVIAYLQRVDRAAAAQAEQLYAPYRPYADWPTVGNYRTAPADIRAPIRAGVAEVADMLNRERTRYEAASSARAFADASRHARTVVQAEALYSGTGDRDAFMAENALWLLDQAGPGARIALWAHNGHVQRAPDNFASMGAVLDRALGTEMLVVGFAFGRAPARRSARPPASPPTPSPLPSPTATRPDSPAPRGRASCSTRVALTRRARPRLVPRRTLPPQHRRRVRCVARDAVLPARTAGPAVRSRGLFRRHERLARLSRSHRVVGGGVRDALMDLRPFLRHRDFRWLFAAQFVSNLGSMVTYVALPYQVYRLTESSFAVGLLGVAELVPLLVTAFIGGALADWLDRRRIVLATEVGLAVGSGFLTLNALLPRRTCGRCSWPRAGCPR
jgi:erythromycin esterase-like protein